MCQRRFNTRRMRVVKLGHTLASPPASFGSALPPSSFTRGVGGLQLTPYPLAISNRYASTSSDEGVDNASFFMTFPGINYPHVRSRPGSNKPHPFADAIVSVFHHSQGELPTVLVHQHLPQQIQLWESPSWIVNADGGSFSGIGPPFNSVRGAACMMLQMLSITRGSGSLTLFGRFQRQLQRSRETRDVSLLIQEPEPRNNQFAMQLEELEQFDVNVLIDCCSPGDQRVVLGDMRCKLLFSTLTLAVSSLPRSNSVAMSRLALFACASFFSWSVRRRWIDRLFGRDVSGAIPCCGKEWQSTVFGPEDHIEDCMRKVCRVESNSLWPWSGSR